MLTLLLLIPSSAFADDTLPAPPPEENAPPALPPAESIPAEVPPVAPPPAEAPTASAPPAEPSPTRPDLSEAEEIPTLSKKLLRFFKPSPYHLPANPRGQVDFTAYTLEWGEVKLGVSNLSIGILPHVQVGTSVPLDVLGIPNVQAKIHATDKGMFDMAAWVEYDSLVRTDFDASLLTAGTIASFQVAPPWGIHIGGSYTRAQLAGDINLESIPQLLWFLDDSGTGNPDHAGSLLHVESVGVKFATDIRFNRRDAIVIQASATIYSDVEHDQDLYVPTFLGLEDALDQDGFISPLDAGMASIAWQFCWEHWEARAGAGVSSLPGAWVLSTWELSYRFGGKTRRKEQRMLDTWQKNKEDIAKPAGPPKP